MPRMILLQTKLDGLDFSIIPFFRFGTIPQLLNVSNFVHGTITGHTIILDTGKIGLAFSLPRAVS